MQRFDRADDEFTHWQWPTDQQSHDLNRHASHNFGQSTHSSLDSRSPSTAPMNRFIGDYERHFFTTQSLPVELLALPHSPRLFAQSAPHFPQAGSDCSPNHRHFTPTSNSISSSRTSRGPSERAESPWASPPAGVLCNPYLCSNPEDIHFAYGGQVAHDGYEAYGRSSCVALHDVQKCADSQFISIAEDDVPPACYSGYGAVAQEGYQEVSTFEDDSSKSSLSTPVADYIPDQRARHHDSFDVPGFRRRRTRSSRSLTQSNRVIKRPPMAQRSATYQSGSKSVDNDRDDNGEGQHIITSRNRAFPCPLAIYGCTSTFGSKNEWKRHVSTQHMRLGFWRCDQCAAVNGERKPNDFNRKDLFIQHVRRMHPSTTFPSPSNNKKSPTRNNKGDSEEQVMQSIAAKCYRHLRNAPEQSACLFCDREFRGPGTWDERMEHVGRHMEAAKKENSGPVPVSEWRLDRNAQQWMVDTGIVRSRGGTWILN